MHILETVSHWSQESPDHGQLLSMVAVKFIAREEAEEEAKLWEGSPTWSVVVSCTGTWRWGQACL